MIEPLIKHFLDITGHRDHRLLDISVVCAVRDLVGAPRVRALEIFRFRDGLFVRPQVWMQDGKVISGEDIVGADHGGASISQFPVLAACIEQHISYAEETNAAGEFVLWLPVWINDKVVTCLEVINSTPYSSHTRDIINGVLGVYRNYQSLLDYSERDSLTGLFNRKTFDENFSKMLSASTQLDEPVPDEHANRRQNTPDHEQWLAVVDIDHFKRVNDQFGHLYGDEVLILVANILRTSFRAYDRIFRFGGEEFVILLRATTRDDAGKVFNRFRGNIEKHTFPQVGTVTVSVGFASIRAGETPVVILGHADQALYYAKEHGRNQVCNYHDLVIGGQLDSPDQPSVEFFFDSPVEPTV